MKKFLYFVVIIILAGVYLNKQVENGNFQAYLDRNKDYVFVESIQYFAAWYKYSRSGYESSVFRFNKFLEMYPESKYEEDVLFLLGASYEGLQNRQDARKIYTKYLEKFENGKKAGIVTKKLRYLSN